MDLSEITKPMKEFIKNSIRLVKRCTKPDAKGKKAKDSEFSVLARSESKRESRGMAA